jgi:hypothetical protein
VKQSIVQAIIVVLIIAVIGAILFPIFAQAPPHDSKTIALANIKQLGTSILIYQSDYDDRYPHATAMPGLRASIFPYCKNNSLFQPTTQSAASEFNFNYAGTTSTQVPIGYTQPLNPSDTTVWYTLCTMKDKPGAFRSHSDSSANFSKLQPLFESFQYQFDRSKIVLAQTDYLENEDPMKEVKVQIQGGNK